MIRHALILLGVGLALDALRSNPAHAGPSDGVTLTSKELISAFAPHVDGVRTCYLRHVAAGKGTGEVRLEFIIAPDGKVAKFGFVAPGIAAGTNKKLGRCLSSLSAAWVFPARRGYTSAILPYKFQRTVVPGGGPYPGCPSKKGCSRDQRGEK